MSPHQLTSRLISEIQQVVTDFSPTRKDTDREQLAALARSVLRSVDVRDLKGITGQRLIAHLEDALHTMQSRKRGEIRACVRFRDEQVVVIETCIEDQPFLVSTMRALLASERLELKRFLNAIVQVRRDSAGNIVRIGEDVAESVMRIEAIATGPVEDGLEKRVEYRLRLAQAMVRDFKRMKRRIGELAERYFAAAADHDADRALRLREAEALLRWLCDENFVLLSVETYDAKGAPSEVLGISTIRQPVRSHQALTGALDFQRLVRYERSVEESPVHRAGKPGYFSLPLFDGEGQRTGTGVIHGLFTYKALHTPPEEIPFIRIALRDLLSDRGVSVDSHRGKSMTNAFNSLPLEYLLSERRESVWEVTDQILRAEAEGGSDVHIQIGDDGRHAFVIVTLPRSQFSEELRQQVQEILLHSLHATYADYGLYIDRYDNAVVHYYLTGSGPLHVVEKDAVRDQVLALAKGWNERLRDAIEHLVPEDPEQVESLFEIYEDAFNDEHKRRASVQRLCGDLRCLEALRQGEEIDCDLYVSEFGDHPGTLQLRLFSRTALSLSRELPIIGHFGFDVIDEYSRAVQIPHLPQIDMDNFRLDVRPDRIGLIMGRRAEILAAIRAVFKGQAGDDDLNRLVVSSNLDHRDVEVLRALVAYVHQQRVPFDAPLVRSTLVEHPSVAQALMFSLASRFDPRVADADSPQEAERNLSAELQAVTDYTADRVLQVVAEVVRAIRRTNAYVVDRNHSDALAFKLASQELTFGPEPKPFREIWVHHPDFEGVHLRGGKVARGGLRFSDRPEDFRTEIHGLMATQMVKNVLIIPMGAKGGFVLRHPPGDRDQLRAAGDHYYKLFITALLSLTDNVIDGKVIKPAGILEYEGDDPYLVVAADKGTAHLSDTANAISMRRGFWLDDAFASGGSNGYDHKATGITARGAWEVTKRSFRELGIDPENDVITAVGVGDMSGDVFGNGFLRTRTCKLLAAFNHMHIFVDPNPDPHASFAERERLFALPRSQWADYDPAVLSPGGGVFPRKSKEVALSSEARRMLGFRDEERLNGDQVIRAILRLDVDLMWMGGIGTYAKSKAESHADVGDKANDSVRIDGHQLRCKVLAEGANLAITDRGRVEYARNGGHNYNAFLDNSGGVDTSDHEVNIKILFAPLLAAGQFTREKRNEVLVAAEDSVVEMVLDNNRSQSRMVSYDVRRSRHDLYRYARTLRHLVRDVPFNPEAFALPNEEELASRARRNEGLYKCEAAVMCAHAKMLAYRQLLEDEPLDDSVVDEMVREYFPAVVLDAAGDAVRGHLLRREIATTLVVNTIVDNAGGTFFSEVSTSTGRSARDVAHAYWTSARAAGLKSLQEQLYELEDPRRQNAVYAGMVYLQSALEEATYYLLDQVEVPAFTADEVAQAAKLLHLVEPVLPPESSRSTESRIQKMVDGGIDEPLARSVARTYYLTPVLDAIRLCTRLGRPPQEVLELRLRIADEMYFARLRHAIADMAHASPWDGPAASALGRQLAFHLRKLVQLVDGNDVEETLHRYGLDETRAQLAEHLENGVTISSLVMLDDQLRRLLPPESTILRQRNL